MPPNNKAVVKTAKDKVMGGLLSRNASQSKVLATLLTPTHLHAFAGVHHEVIGLGFLPA
jgi:hypothetical protein